MSFLLKSTVLGGLLLAGCTAVFAQGTLADYQRAETMNGSIQNKIYNSPSSFKWLAGKNQYFYSVLDAKGTSYKIVDAKSGETKPAFNQQQLASLISERSGKTINPYQIPASAIRIGNDGSELDYTADSTIYTVDLATLTIKNSRKIQTRRPNDNPSDSQSKSPDGKWTAYIKNFNVFIKANNSKNQATQLSFDGAEGDYYSDDLAWSPDSRHLATYKVRPGQKHLIYLIESSPTTQLQPILQSRDYLKPGDALEQKQPALFSIGQKRQITVTGGDIQNQYFLRDLIWRKNSRAFTFEYNRRGHQVYSIINVDTTGRLSELVKEQTPTFFTYYSKRFRYDLNDGQETIWMSERDGWNHLYLYGANGKVKNQITKGNWVVRNVITVNEQQRYLIFEGSGMEDGQDPYFIQYYKINLDGTGLVKLTSENGNHKATFASDYSTFIDTYSRVDEPQITLLRDGNTGKVLKTLEKGNIDALLQTGWKLPEVFSAKGRDGKTAIWGIVVRPSNFDPKKKYPIIEYIYAGPHDSFVPKSFVNDSRGSLHELAELGFIVVQCDGMGTSNRSKAFHDVCYKNLRDAGFPDRIAWIKALASKYSYMDTTKVGIFGNSAGGQSSLGALLFHPEFYKVAVSSSGCHDNRMDKIWWNEQWMGYPIGPQYAESSNIDNAYRLQGKLLLILGELDDNVDPSSTMQVINQLIKNNKNFDFLMVPGMKHSLGGDYGEHKRRDFFVKHLLGVNPPEWTWTPNITVAKP